MISRKLVVEFFKFGIVGFMGFLVDAGVLQACTSSLGMDPYSGRVVSFFIAVTSTWFFNRVFTFRAHRNEGSIFRQWLKFTVACSGGMALNYTTYALLVAHVPLVANHLILGVAAGSVAGMFFNFFASKKAVFR